MTVKDLLHVNTEHQKQLVIRYTTAVWLYAETYNVTSTPHIISHLPFLILMVTGVFFPLTLS